MEVNHVGANEDCTVHRDRRNVVQPRSFASVFDLATTQAGASEIPMYRTLPARKTSSKVPITSSAGVIWSHP